MEKFSLDHGNLKTRIALSEEKLGLNIVPAEKEMKMKSNNFYLSIRKNRFSRLRDHSIGQIEATSHDIDISNIDTTYLINMDKLEGNFMADVFLNIYLNSNDHKLQHYGLQTICKYLKSIQGKLDSLTQYLVNIMSQPTFLLTICDITSNSSLDIHKALSAKILNETLDIIYSKQNVDMFQSSIMINHRNNLKEMTCQYLNDTKFIDSLIMVTSENVLEKQLHLLGLAVHNKNVFKEKILLNLSLMSKFENILESGFSNEIKNQVIWICNLILSITDNINTELSRLNKSIFEWVYNLNHKLRSIKSELIQFFECKSEDSISILLKNTKPVELENYSLAITHLSLALGYLYRFSIIDSDIFYEFFELKHAEALFNIGMSVNEVSSLANLIEKYRYIVEPTQIPIIYKKLRISVISCLSIISNILSGSNSNTDELINFGVIYFYKEILNQCKNQIKMDWSFHEEILMGVSNIACGTLCHISHLSILYDTILEITQVLSSCSMQESEKVLKESLVIITSISKSGLISKANYILSNEIININQILILAFNHFKSDSYYSNFLENLILATIRLINLDLEYNVNPKIDKSTYLTISSFLEEIQMQGLAQESVIHKLQNVLES